MVTAYMFFKLLGQPAHHVVRITNLGFRAKECAHSGVAMLIVFDASWHELCIPPADPADRRWPRPESRSGSPHCHWVPIGRLAGHSGRWNKDWHHDYFGSLDRIQTHRHGGRPHYWAAGDTGVADSSHGRPAHGRSLAGT